MVFIIFITNCLTFLISILGIMLSIGVICREAARPHDDKSAIEEGKKNILQWLKDKDANIDKIGILIADYKSGNEWIAKGQNATYFNCSCVFS